jgi:hypothetical protein
MMHTDGQLRNLIRERKIMTDDAVVVLVNTNPNQEESEFEYRVSYTDNIEALYGIFDSVTGKWNGDHGMILDLFAEKTIFTDIEIALETAQSLAQDYGNPELGIVVMKDFQSKSFYEL